MKTPKEILDLQEQSIARSKKALALVQDDKLIAWNSSRLLQNTLMAWLMAKRHELDFDIDELVVSINIYEDNFELIKSQPEMDCTYYLLACMICDKAPIISTLEYSKSKATDINYLIDSSAVPYVYFGLANSSEVIAALKKTSDNRRDLSINSAINYLNLMAGESEPTSDVIDELTSLFTRRKKDDFYSESRIYGGGPDNDMVCDVEYAAVASAKGFSLELAPAVNKTLHRTSR